jgi:nitroreductase
MATEEYINKHPELIDVIMERRSIRKYTDEKISDEDIEKILLAGHYAPNAANKQTWEFIAVTNMELNKKIAKIVDDCYDTISDILDDKDAKKTIKYSKFYATFFKNAPLAVYCVATPYISGSDASYAMLGEEGRYYRENRENAQSGLQSVCAAIENMILAGWALGIGSVWLTAPIVAKDEIEKILEIKEGRLVAVVAFGYPSQAPKEPTRKPLGEVVRYIR